MAQDGNEEVANRSEGSGHLNRSDGLRAGPAWALLINVRDLGAGPAWALMIKVIDLWAGLAQALSIKVRVWVAGLAQVPLDKSEGLGGRAGPGLANRSAVDLV